MAISAFPTRNVTITPGTSLIECETLSSSVPDLYDVKLLNTSSFTLQNYSYNFNRLILAGTGQVNTQNDLVLNELIFETDGATLALDISSNFNLNVGMESQTSIGNPGILKSGANGTQATVNKPTGNICAMGPIGFQDIDGILNGVFNAPEGVDNGNNNGINFDDGSTGSSLYWIAGNGDWQVPSNWSRVSGGCPSSNNPNNAPSLIFDDYSFTQNNQIITVPNGTNCKEINFHAPFIVDFDITVGLGPDRLVISGGIVNMNGESLIVKGETKIENSASLSTDMVNFTTKSLNATSGAYILKAGSNATIKP